MEQRYKTALEIVIGLLKLNPFMSADILIRVCETALNEEKEDEVE